ncbi:MAG: molybdopterin molybdotransferase MoeA [Nitriliruptoraceae bacterium]|nr:molybdopterin molybdotransferase MoeA [Nitriliruptoraceae bacterium]
MSRFVGHGRGEVTPIDELTPVDEHLREILALLPEPDPIELRLPDALGLVLADPVTSSVSVPAFPNSGMDGYAVLAGDVEAATVDAPVGLRVVGEILAGSASLPEVRAGTAVRIMTGAPVPPGADAVVPVETTSEDGSNGVRIHRPVHVGQHVRRPGEDLQPGQPLVAAGRRLSPADLALLAAAGVTRVNCVPPPRVVILVSGDELVPADHEPGPGQIRDVNGPMLSAMVRAAGGVPFFAGIVRDDRKALTYTFDTNLGHADLFLCSGGASAGTADLLPDVIGRLGQCRAVKVAMKPGMPQIRGRIADTPVIGLPGNPVSSFVSFETFVRPAIRHLQGRRDVQRPSVIARAGEPLTAPPAKRGYLRVTLARDEQGWIATPTGHQGSHVISSIAAADGLAVVPEDVTEIAPGEQVRVHLLVE